MTAKSRTSRTASSPTPSPGDDLGQLVSEFGQRLLAAADPLEAEALAAAALALPRREGIGAGLAGLFTTVLTEAARQNPSAEAAALLRALAAVVPPAERGQVVAGLGEVTGAGYYPPEWAAQIGRAAPGEAWRRTDVFGDTETIGITFRYGDEPHGMLVQLDRCRQPTVLHAVVVREVAELRSVLDSDEGGMALPSEPIGLADARARIEEALTRDHPDDHADLPESSVHNLPIARARVRRLPAGEPPAPARYRAADRSAVVTEFLASPYAAEAGDEKTARFWAEVLAGYSAYVPGDPPARIGTMKLGRMLLSYVPNTFALTDEQRRGMPDAVTAWSRWAAGRQQLTEPARATLAQRLPEVLASFDEAYDDPENAGRRGYLADLAATTTDAQVLADTLNRRALAVPLPADRGGDKEDGGDADGARLRDLDAADPAQRRTVIEHEYGGCEPPAGMSRPEFLAAAVRVCEQLWHDDPPELWQRAERLVDAGTDGHEVIHRLIADTGG